MTGRSSRAPIPLPGCPKGNIHFYIEGIITAMVNASPTFVSRDLNKPGGELVVSENPQPLSTARTVAKLREIPRRSRPGEEGFDGLGVVVVSCINDGTSVTLVETPPAPEPGDVLHYDAMMNRVANEYDVTLGNL